MPHTPIVPLALSLLLATAAAIAQELLWIADAENGAHGSRERESPISR